MTHTCARTQCLNCNARKQNIVYTCLSVCSHSALKTKPSQQQQTISQKTDTEENTHKLLYERATKTTVTIFYVAVFVHAFEHSMLVEQYKFILLNID